MVDLLNTRWAPGGKGTASGDVKKLYLHAVLQKETNLCLCSGALDTATEPTPLIKSQNHDLLDFLLDNKLKTNHTSVVLIEAIKAALATRDHAALNDMHIQLSLQLLLNGGAGTRNSMVKWISLQAEMPAVNVLM